MQLADYESRSMRNKIKGEEKCMKLSIDKTKATIAIFLMITIGIALIPLQAVNAHDPPLSIPTWAFIQAVVNPVGVNQQTYIYMWIDKVIQNSALVNEIRFRD